MRNAATTVALPLLLVLCCLGLAGCGGAGTAAPVVSTPTIAAPPTIESKPTSLTRSAGAWHGPVGDIPPYAEAVARYVLQHHRAPDGYVGGRTYSNRGSYPDMALPRRAASGASLSYTEWDVHAHRRGVNRGAERLVIDDLGHVYYTADHYRTFVLDRATAGGQ